MYKKKQLASQQIIAPSSDHTNMFLLEVSILCSNM